MIRLPPPIIPPLIFSLGFKISLFSLLLAVFDRSVVCEIIITLFTICIVFMNVILC